MHSAKYSIGIAFFLLGKLSEAQSVDTNLVTITAAQQWIVEPDCAQSCLWWSTGSIQLYLLSQLGCTGSSIYNECYCTQIQDQKASSYMSYCIDEECTGTALLSNALSFYESYCDGAGYARTALVSHTTSTSPTQSAAATQSSTTASPGNSGSTASVAANTSPPSSSSTSNQPSTTSTKPNSGSKSHTGAIVGGVIGGLAAIALVLGGIFFYLRSQRKNAENGQNQGHNQEAGAAPSPAAAKPEKEVAPIVTTTARAASPVSPIEPEKPVAETKKPGRAELPAEGKYGLRPEELDAEGRYVGELHGDGRQAVDSELP